MSAFFTWITNFLTEFYNKLEEWQQGVWQWIWDYMFQFLAEYLFPLWENWVGAYPGVQSWVANIQPYLGLLNMVIPMALVLDLMGIYLAIYFGASPVKMLFKVMQGR